MKITIYILILLTLLSCVFASENICGGVVEPNQECQMVTPSLSCTNYTYKLFNNNSTLIEENNLTLWTDSDIYYFNFSENIGEYLIKLCDDTTREVVVKIEEDKMIAVTLGFIVLIIYFLIMGIIIKHPYLKFGSFSFAVIEIVMMVFYHFGTSTGGNTIRILEVNFWVMVLISFGLLMWKGSETAISMMSLDDKKKNQEEGWDNKW